ncbi:MAG TPA: hypothetical protein VHF89_01085 [Solirubrobacteraceae bacterium]|nr:hypothetical protein [Solirubrobacteraceae bacterium]
MKRTLLPLLLCAAALAGGTGVAEAAAPPRGTYDCRFFESGRTYGLIKLVDGRTYTFNRGKRGGYRSRGQRITFTSGPMKGVFEHAVWKRDGGLVYLNLFDGEELGRTATDAQCIRRKS